MMHPSSVKLNLLSCLAFTWLVNFAGIAELLAEQPRRAGVEVFRDTEPLLLEGDLAAQMVDGVDRFLLRELDQSVERRASYWNFDSSSPSAYEDSVKANRERLVHILGMRDERIPFDGLELLETTNSAAMVAKTDRYQVFAVRWPVVGDMHAEGLYVVPANRNEGSDGATARGIVADVVVLPDADQQPEMLLGLVEGIAPESQYARRLAESGCRLLIPALIDRTIEPRNGRAQVSSREFLYRSAFELGRHLVGYEVQKVLAAVDWFERDAARHGEQRPIGVWGWGEGGMLAFYAGAVDPRIAAVGVSGYFAPRETIWEQPLDRNVFGLLERFGDAELSLLVAPRPLVVEVCRTPELELPSKGGAPAILATPAPDDVRRELARAERWLAKVPSAAGISPYFSEGGTGPFGTESALTGFSREIGRASLRPSTESPIEVLRDSFDFAGRQQRQFHEIDRHNQAVLAESAYVRQKFMDRLDTSSLESFEKSVEWYRDFFREEVIGHFSNEVLPPNVRTRKAYDEEKWTGYEVVMDVFPDVFAYGILLMPKDIQPGERRPVVVCQHGLEGRPQDIITGNHPAYHDFAAKLAERGFITFSPQNLYIGQDRFRTLQRKANPLKKTLFSVIVPQHQQMVDWLKSLPEVDGERIAFYGLSYGGKSAMRIPPLVADYCLSICSADFNEWVWKNASSRAPHSYVWTGEYEIFEFDLGSTFNYAEMAALIAPRPFMVERGHYDGVAPDEAVGYEFAKVRFLYQGKLKLRIAARLNGSMARTRFTVWVRFNSCTSI
jgi:dienelactone hydrolase